VGSELSESKLKPFTVKWYGIDLEFGILRLFGLGAGNVGKVLGELEFYRNDPVFLVGMYILPYSVLPVALSANYALIHIRKE
jgi:hypothetical protein